MYEEKKKQPATVDTEGPSVPTVSKNKSTLRQANSAPTSNRSQSTFSLPPALPRWRSCALTARPHRWLPSSRQDTQQKLSVPLDHSHPQDHPRELNLWCSWPTARSEPFPTTSVQKYAGTTGEKCGQNPVTSQNHLTPICSVGGFCIRHVTGENKDLHVYARSNKPACYCPPAQAVLIKTAPSATILSPYVLTWCYNWISILLLLSCKTNKLLAALAFQMLQKKRIFDT